MTQIRKIKGIAGKLPEKQSSEGSQNVFVVGAVTGVNDTLDEVLSIELDPNECACVDVEKVARIAVGIVATQDDKIRFPDRGHYNYECLESEIAEKIKLATSNCLKWREDE